MRRVVVETMRDMSHPQAGHSEESMSFEDAETAFNNARKTGSAVFAEAGGQALGNIGRGESLPENVEKMTIVPPQAGG